MTMADREYVLGTGDVEVERLGLQHRIWRPDALAGWRGAGFTAGQTLLDVGCGPGYATVDLAEIVGPSGRVLAMDQSRRFLDVLEAQIRHRRLDNVTPTELDLGSAALPEVRADGAWCRWIFCFVPDPRRLVERIARRLTRGAALVVHEYFHYETWRFAPPLAEHQEFVREVVASWRDSGGEPDIALVLPRWLEELGFRVEALRPIVHVVGPESYIWQWPASFVTSGLDRMVTLGRISPHRASEIATAIARAELEPGVRMVTPAVLEIVARKA